MHRSLRLAGRRKPDLPVRGHNAHVREVRGSPGSGEAPEEGGGSRAERAVHEAEVLPEAEVAAQGAAQGALAEEPRGGVRLRLLRQRVLVEQKFQRIADCLEVF